MLTVPLLGTRYYQPIPDAIKPFPVNPDLQDPDFEKSCNGVEGNCANAWGVRIIDSQDIFIYGAGTYSFFNNYDTSKLSHIFPFQPPLFVRDLPQSPTPPCSPHVTNNGAKQLATRSTTDPTARRASTRSRATFRTSTSLT